MDNLDIEHCGSLPPEQSVTGNFLKSHYRLDAYAYISKLFPRKSNKGNKTIRVRDSYS